MKERNKYLYNESVQNIHILIKTCIICICLLSAFGYAKGLAKERELIFNKLLRNDVSLFEIEKELMQYMQQNNVENVEAEGLGMIRRKFEFMRMRVNREGFYRPVDIRKEMKAYREKYAQKFLRDYKWAEMGPRTSANVTGHWAPGIGRLDVVNVNSTNTKEILAGAPTGGLWKTTDEGSSWECLTDDVPVIGVAGIAIDWSNPNVIYIATGDKDAGDNNSVGVLKSTDGGATWKETGLSFDVSDGTTIRRMIMHPTNPNTIFVGYSHGIYRTTDGGANWAEVLESGWYNKIDDIEFKPGDLNTVYAASYDSDGSYFYKSTNGGSSFSQVSAGLPTNSRIQITVTEAAPDYVYFLSTSGIYRSTNSGESFSYRGSYPGNNRQTYYDLAFAASHTDPDEVYAGEIEIYRSTNGGQNFTKLTEWQWPNTVGYTHCDIHELVFYGSTLYVGSDGLICKTTDNGESWINMTEGIGNRQFRKLAVSRTSGNVIALGSQDNGTTVYTNGEWHEWLGADGSDPVIDVNDEKIIYGCTQSAGSLYKSTNGGYEGGNVNVSNPQPNGGAFVTPMTITGDNTIILGAGDVFKSADGMQSWDQLSNFGWGWNNGSGTNRRITGLGVCYSNSDYIYASETWTNNIRGTSNGGSSWQDISSGLPDEYITFIAVHPTKPEKVAVTISGYSAGEKVVVSENGGSSWNNISGSLPNLPAICAIWDEKDDGLYIGMEVGVYYKGNSMSDFVPYFNALPNVIVNELDIHHGLGKIRAATYGRGLWEAPLYGTSNISSNIITPIIARHTVITIYSLQGRKIYSAKANNANILSLVNNLPVAPGIYFLRYPVSQKSYSSKLIVKK